MGDFFRIVFYTILSFHHTWSKDDCNHHLGMSESDKRIPDESITSSSKLSLNHAPSNARLDGPRAWCSALDDDSPYIQIRFVKEKLITAIETQGSAPDNSWSTKYDVHYLKKGKWTLYKEGLAGNRHPKRLQKNSFKATEQFRTYSIRIYPKEPFVMFPELTPKVPCLRLELYGCTAPAPPRFTNVSNDKSVREGSDLQLFCYAYGRPTPNITWLRITSSGSESDVLHRGTIWDMKDISRTEAGVYRCIANNGVGNPVNHTLRVYVEFPPNITLQNKYYVGREKSVSLDCKVDGYPIPTITWTPCDAQENECDQSTLNISKVQNDGVYTCTAKNRLGNDKANTSLVIGAKVINVTLTITNRDCKRDDQSFLQSLKEAILALFPDNNDLVVKYKGHSCGSLIVERTLEFASIVSEASVVNTLRTAATKNNFGEFAVNASSIQGIAVIERTSTPPTEKIL